MAQTPPIWDRSRLRWFNGLGFGISFLLAMWILLALIMVIRPDPTPRPMPYPVTYVVVTAAALIAVVALFGVLLFRVMWHGRHFSEYKPRLYLFFWTCAGLLFFLCQAVMLLRYGWKDFPRLEPWASSLFWALCWFGLGIFGVLAYVNADVLHHDEHEDDEHEDDEAYDEPDDDEPPVVQPLASGNAEETEEAMF